MLLKGYPMPIANTPRQMAHLKQVDPEHLVRDKIQPGHRLFGLVWINPDIADCGYNLRSNAKIIDRPD